MNMSDGTPAGSSLVILSTGTSTAASRPRPHGPVLLLADPNDGLCLSPTLCLLRSLIEVFPASPSDVEARRRKGGLKEPLAVGRIGLRCIHCAYVPDSDRSIGAVTYPKNLSLIHQAVRNFQRYHFKTCAYIPQQVKAAFDQLPKRQHAAKNSDKFWVRSAEEKGMMDIPGTENENAAGMRFRDGFDWKRRRVQVPVHGHGPVVDTSTLIEDTRSAASSINVGTLPFAVERVELSLRDTMDVLAVPAVPQQSSSFNCHADSTSSSAGAAPGTAAPTFELSPFSAAAAKPAASASTSSKATGVDYTSTANADAPLGGGHNSTLSDEAFNIEDLIRALFAGEEDGQHQAASADTSTRTPRSPSGAEVGLLHDPQNMLVSDTSSAIASDAEIMAAAAAAVGQPHPTLPPVPTASTNGTPVFGSVHLTGVEASPGAELLPPRPSLSPQMGGAAALSAHTRQDPLMSTLEAFRGIARTFLTKHHESSTSGSSSTSVSSGTLQQDLNSLGQALYNTLAGEEAPPSDAHVPSVCSAANGVYSRQDVDTEGRSTKRERVRGTSSGLTCIPLKDLGYPLNVSIFVTNLLDATDDSAKERFTSAKDVDDELGRLLAEPERYLFDPPPDSITGELCFPPGRLYGRGIQQEKLMSAFFSIFVSCEERSGLALLSGHSGSGKVS